MSCYNKPFRSFDEQLELLKSRGLEITHDDRAQVYLRRLGYYRLSGYWYPFRKMLFVDHGLIKYLALPQILAKYQWLGKYYNLIVEQYSDLCLALQKYSEKDLTGDAGYIDSPFIHLIKKFFKGH